MLGIGVAEIEVAHRNQRVRQLARRECQLDDLADALRAVFVRDVVRVTGVQVGVDERQRSARVSSSSVAQPLPP